MKFNKLKLGNLVEFYSEKCGISNLTKWEVSGINKDKEFFGPSKQVGADTSDYQIVPPTYFACNLMHVGRDKLLPVALNYSDNKKYVKRDYLNKEHILLNCSEILPENVIYLEEGDTVPVIPLFYKEIVQ